MKDPLKEAVLNACERAYDQGWNHALDLALSRLDSTRLGPEDYMQMKDVTHLLTLLRKATDRDRNRD